MTRKYTSIFPLALLLLAGLFAGVKAYAQFTKPALQTIIANCFPTQTTGAITPAITVTCLDDIIASYQQYAAVNPQVGTTYTFQNTDYGQMVTFTNAAPISTILPSPANSGFNPWSAYVVNRGGGQVTIGPTGGATINGSSTLVLTNGSGAFIVSDGTNYQVFQGSAVGVANIVAGTTTITGGVNQGVVYNNGGIFTTATTLPTGLTIPNLTLTGSPAGAGSFITINSTNCQLAGSCTVTGPIVVGTTVVTGGTNNGLLYNNGSSLGNTTGGNNATLITSAAGVPSISNTLPTSVQVNITSTGTLASGSTGAGFTLNFGSSTLSGNVPLTNGGTNANLTANNGAVAWSTSSALSFTAAPATSNLCLLSGVLAGAATPIWGSCSGGGAAVASVSATNSTVTVTPTTGSVTITLNLANANTWTGSQTFSNGTLVLGGASSGGLTIGAPAVADSYSVAFPTPSTTSDTITLLGTAQTFSAAKTFSTMTLKIGGGSSGATTLASANAGASNFTITLPSATDTVALLGTNQTFTATETISGTLNINAAGTFQSVGNTMTFPGSAANLAALNLTNQSLSGGAYVTSFSYGTATSPTQVDCSKAPLATLTNSGAFALTAPASDSSCVIAFTNGGGASIVNFYGFSTNASFTGGTLDTTAGHKFLIVITRIGSSIYNIIPQQ